MKFRPKSMLRPVQQEAITHVYERDKSLPRGRGALPRHGHSVGGESPTYTSWRKMRNRCEDPANEWFHRYGGRGIRVCRRWAKFDNFLADMGVRPKGKTLDRENPNGNYTPSNCRWATPKEQSRHNHRIIDTPRGRMTLTRAAEVSGLDYYTLRYRLRMKWRTARLFDPQYSHMHGTARC